MTVAAVDLPTLGRYLLERLDRVPGVTGTRARIATRLYAEGSLWRLGVLPAAAGGAPLPPTRTATLDTVDRELMSALGVDARASYATLAQVTGISQPTARRRVDRLISSGAILLRTEVAAPLAGWPVSVVLSADAPAGRLHDVATTLARLRQVRLCATLASTPSLLVVAWLSSLEEVHRFEQDFLQKVPDVEVLDRLVVLRAGQAHGPPARRRRARRRHGADGRVAGPRGAGRIGTNRAAHPGAGCGGQRHAITRLARRRSTAVIRLSPSRCRSALVFTN